MELLAKKQCHACNAVIPNGYLFCKICKRDRFLGIKPWELLFLSFLLFGCVSSYSVGRLFMQPPPLRTATPIKTATAQVIFTPIHITLTKTVSATPPATATNIPQQTFMFDWTKCRRDYETRLKINDIVTIGTFSSVFGYNVLEGPYIDRKKIGGVSPGDSAKIIEGPSCSNKWIWWKVELEKDGTTGWISEGDSTNYWLIPINGEQITQNEYASVSNQIDFVSLRKSPGYISKDDNKDVIVEIASGQKLEIIRGPETADGLKWWYVKWRGYQGWVAEKTGKGKTILIFNE